MFACLLLALTFIWPILLSLTSFCRLSSISCRTGYLNNTANSRSFMKMFDRTSVSNGPGENLTFYLDIYFCVYQGLFETLNNVLLFPMCFFTLFILSDYVDWHAICRIQIASAHIHHSYSSIYDRYYSLHRYFQPLDWKLRR